MSVRNGRAAELLPPPLNVQQLWSRLRLRKCNLAILIPHRKAVAHTYDKMNFHFRTTSQKLSDSVFKFNGIISLLKYSYFHRSFKNCFYLHHAPRFADWAKALLDIIYKNKSLSNRSRFVKQTNRQHTEGDDDGNYIKSSCVHKIISCGEWPQRKLLLKLPRLLNMRLLNS